MARRSVLRTILALVAANAVLGVFILLGGDMGETEGKVLATSLLVTLGVTLGLVCAPAATAGRARVWPRLGMAAAAVATVAFVISVWSDSQSALLRTGGVALSYGVAAALVSVLSAWPGTGRLAWMGGAATALASVGATMVSAGIVFEIGAEGYWRLFGVAMVLLASAAIATPIVHRMGPAAGVDSDHRHCPYCGSPAAGHHGQVTHCPHCGRSFVVRPA